MSCPDLELSRAAACWPRRAPPPAWPCSRGISTADGCDRTRLQRDHDHDVLGGRAGRRGMPSSPTRELLGQGLALPVSAASMTRSIAIGHWPRASRPKRIHSTSRCLMASSRRRTAEDRGPRGALVSSRPCPAAQEPLGRDPAQSPCLLCPMAGCRSLRRGRFRLRLRRVSRSAEHIRCEGGAGCLAGGVARARHDRECADRVALRR